MKQKINGHNVEYVKRLAKKIKREQDITHHQALEIAAVNLGFSNWKHFLRNTRGNLNNLPSKDNIQVKPLSENRKNDPYRNLLAAAVNKLIEEKYISLILENVNEEQEKGHIFLELFKHNSVIIWRNIGFGELSISVWWKYDHRKHPQANLEGRYKENFNSSKPLANKSHYKKLVGVTASCWLERITGKYIQGKNRRGLFDIYTRKGELEVLKELPTQKPKGYEISGLFHI